MALITLLVACSGCGGGAEPRHGIVLAHTTNRIGGTLSGGGDFYLWQPGAKPRRLMNSRDLLNEPAWSPSGKQIA